MLIFAVIVLSILSASLLTLLYILKHNIHSISKQLKEHANRNITLSSADKDLTELAVMINKNIQSMKENQINTYRDKKQLSDDITNISHDLRTPLTSIIGYLQLLQKTKLDDKQAEYLDAALRKSDSLYMLVKDFFELSYRTDDNLTLQKINLCNFITECIVDYSKNFEEKKITPVVNFPEKPVFIITDSDILNRIMQNILANIIKHGVETFTATIEDSENVYIRFENITDGADNIDAGRLFDKFYTPDKSRGNSSYGLGLAIIKLLVEKLNGSVAAGISGNKFIISIVFHHN